MGDMANFTNSRLTFSKPRRTNKTTVAAFAGCTDVPCPKCKKQMKLKSGVRGDFWGCTDFPKCKGSRGVLR